MISIVKIDLRSQLHKIASKPSKNQEKELREKDGTPCRFFARLGRATVVPPAMITTRVIE